MTLSNLTVGVPPYRLTGTVYGTLANDRALLEKLGDSIEKPPYKAAPKAPVLYVKPRNTLSTTGASMAMPADVNEMDIGATIGLVIGRVASRLKEEDALDYVSGVTLVADLRVPHDSFYRPSVRFNARDGSCFIGPEVVGLADLPKPDEIALTVFVDGQEQPSVRPQRIRSAAKLLADVTDFMTLVPGDVLLLGIPASMPRVRAGQNFAIAATGIGRLEGVVV
ncbi:fumarylacetoacetate hydrolase family protein [Cupriavidus basilensis]